MISDSKMYPWFAFNDYLCFRIDIQGSGDSEGVLTDEYTDEELTYCAQVINRDCGAPVLRRQCRHDGKVMERHQFADGGGAARSP